jgi:hypothetical protein
MNWRDATAHPILSARIAEEIACTPLAARQDLDAGLEKHTLHCLVSHMETLLQVLYGDVLVLIQQHNLGAGLFIDLRPSHGNPRVSKLRSPRRVTRLTSLSCAESAARAQYGKGRGCALMQIKPAPTGVN